MPPRTDRRYVLGLLMLVGLFNYVDRLCMSILSVPIRRELALSDTQLGILTGLAFSLVYTLMAVPIARLADRGSRTRVIAGCLAIWSLMTAACGLATGFLMLALLRMGVALGEAGCVPATQALLSDYYSREQRARAIGTWQLVFPLGTLLAFVASGWLGTVMGWRETFVVLGIAGLALAPVVIWTIEEPKRSPSGHRAATLSSAFKVLWRLPSFRWLTIGGAFIAYPMNAALYWNGQFYSRVFGMPLGELALWLALLSGGAGALGLYGGGWIADRLSRRDPRWTMWVPAIAGFAVAPLMLLQYFASDVVSSLWLGVVPVMLLYAFMPPQAAGAQALARPELRALASGTIVLITGTAGTALGPLLTGVLSDAIAQRSAIGDDALRYAIGLSGLLAGVGGVCFLQAARHYPADLERSGH